MAEFIAKGEQACQWLFYHGREPKVWGFRLLAAKLCRDLLSMGSLKKTSKYKWMRGNGKYLGMGVSRYIIHGWPSWHEWNEEEQGPKL